MHAANNRLVSLPLEMGYLVNLEKLHLQKNKLKELPEVFSFPAKNNLIDLTFCFSTGLFKFFFTYNIQ
jgi:Leucine-rich repeat (LRR) protein